MKRFFHSWVFIICTCLSGAIAMILFFEHITKSYNNSHQYNKENDHLIASCLQSKPDSVKKFVYGDPVTTSYYEIYYAKVKICFSKKYRIPYEQKEGVSFSAYTLDGEYINIDHESHWSDCRLAPETYQKIRRMCDTIKTTKIIY